MSTFTERQDGSHSRIDEGGGALGTFFEFAIPELTEHEIRSATLYVCEKAEDAADAALLLEALGLHGTPPPRQKPKKLCPECEQPYAPGALVKHRRTQHGVAA